MQLSIVSTLYRSVPYLEEFHRRASAAAAVVTLDYEMVLVNDGSPDDSLEAALALRACDPRVRVVDLSRNFGHHKAMMTGLAHARGDLVFLIDCDLEEDPEVLGEFHADLHNQGADVVYGVQRERSGGALHRLTGALFYQLYNFLTDYPVPKNVTTTRLMTRRYVSALLEHRERQFHILGLWTITGFKQVAVPVEKRRKPTSAYTLARKVAIVVDAVTSFSSKPLVAVFYLGALISLLAAGGVLAVVINVIFFGGFLVGWASLIVSVWLLGGISIFCIGLVGMYLGKVLIETKRRPYTIVRQVYGVEE